MSERNNHEYTYLAYLTEHREIGERTKRSPQHLTLVPPFSFNFLLPDLREAVREVAAETKAFDVKIDREDKFGPSRNINVFLIKPVDVVRALHYQLMYSLQAVGIYQPTKFVFENFVPHITTKPAHTTNLSKGQIINIDHIAIMHKDKGFRTLLAREELTGEN